MAKTKLQNCNESKILTNYNIMFLSFFKSTEEASNLKNSFIEFYKNPNVVSCVFRALDDLSQALILRLMREGYSISELNFQLMITDTLEAKKKLESSLNLLKSLSIILQREEGNKLSRSFSLNQKFRVSLERFITSPELIPSIPIPSNIQEQEPVPLYNFLYQPKADIITKVLKQSKLIGQYHNIQKDGFSFILQNFSTQICILLKGYVQYRKRMQLWEHILEISNLDMGKAYQVKQSWSQQLINDLRSFKFIMALTMENGKQYICVNRIFKNFSFQEPLLDLSLKCDIIVQTNFKIYAHVKSYRDRTNYQVLKKILDLFIMLDFPQVGFQQLIVGKLVESKVKQAYYKGLTADQILKFFRKHTDVSRIEETKKKTQVVTKMDHLYNQKRNKLNFLKIYTKEQSDILPNNVIQELKLWQEMREWDHDVLAQDST